MEDTIAPKAVIETERTLKVEDPLPEAKDLVTDVQDEAEVQIYYLEEPQLPEDYSDEEVTVVVEDASGNKLQQPCRFRFRGWLRDSCTLELGETLTKEMLLVNPERDGHLLDEQKLKNVKAVGEHTVTVLTGSSEATCVVTVQDTTKPQMKLKNVRIKPGEKVEIEDFLESLSDNAGWPQLRYLSEEPDCKTQGTYAIKIEAKDPSGNVTTGEATLWVSRNMNPPRIKGAQTALEVEKNSEPDYLEGITASDDIDKKVEIKVDASAVDLTKAGTYYITYSAMDSAGNETTCKRKVVVKPNEEDTEELLKKVAEGLEKDPEAIRDYVHDTIAYSSSWGGDDPVWHGLTTNSGNCFVHANTLQKLLEIKGYETQLIWVKNKSHYWVIVKLEEGWRHIDSTPSAQHEKIGLATDQVRYKNLNGRNWDRSQWPACT